MKQFFNNIFHRILRHVSPQALVYTCLWFVVLLIPFARNTLIDIDDEYKWQNAIEMWVLEIPFFIFFIINAALLVPHFFLKQKIGLYIATVTIALIASLYTSEFITENQMHNHRFVPTEDMFDNMPGDVPQGRFCPPMHMMNDEPFHFDHPEDMPNGPRPMMHFIHGPIVGKLFIALLLICFNLAVELFFKSERDKKKITQLKYNEMQTKLDYLKYQINPHFFMNTLNNIHALIDIDTEKAKQTVVELSKLMRYMLYEADKKMILLQKEVQFLQHYAELMRIRYPENSVKIDLDLPTDTGNINIPPLLFVSFVENAFKHGVSFRNESFVNISMHTDDKNIIFTCRNSNPKHNQDQHHGIGLENIRERLELLYPEKYILSIEEQDDHFGVIMVIPAQTTENTEPKIA